MGTPIVVDCEAPFGVGAPSVGDMTEFGAVDVNALQDGRVETFHGVDCSEDTFRQFREWLTPRKPVVFVSDNPAYASNGSISTSGAISARIRSGIPDDASPISTQGWSVIFAALKSGSVSAERSTIIIPSMTRSGTPKRSFDCSTGSDNPETAATAGWIERTPDIASR
jgi:hypothetical protein